MTRIPFDVVAFDLDGTLADTAPDLAAALNHALRSLGRAEIPPETVRNLVGHGARALLRRGLAASGVAPEELVELGFPIFMDFYGENICNGTRLFDGVEPTLQWLKDSDVVLAVCTNKPDVLTHKLVEALGLGRYFDAIVGADTIGVRKPDPAPLREAISRAGGGRAAFVGDSIIDADTARAAGVPFVAVSFGFSDRPIAELGAQAVIDRYADLPSTLEWL